MLYVAYANYNLIVDKTHNWTISMSLSLFIWVQDWVKTEFQTKALTLIHNLTETKTRNPRGPIQPSVPLYQSCYSTVVLKNREIQVSLYLMVFSNCDVIRLWNGLITKTESCKNSLFNGLFVYFLSLQIVKDMWSRETTIRKQNSPQ